MFRIASFDSLKMNLRVKEIIETIPPLKVLGRKDSVVTEVIQLNKENSRQDILAWCNAKNVQVLQEVKAGVIIAPPEAETLPLSDNCTFIIAENPRNYFNRVLKTFFDAEKTERVVSGEAVIHDSVKIGNNACIEHNVRIAEGCIIGNNVTILCNTVIERNTLIGDNVSIGANNIIGKSGFGYEKNTEGFYEQMPHLGNVIINSNVEIGHNNCIDRAVLGSTIIGSHTKIHNFVQVAHGVTIGQNCLITANVTISGGTSIGNEVWIGPASTIINKIKINDNAHIAIGAVVVSDVPENARAIGNPAKILK